MFKSKVRQDGHATAISHLAEMQENGELCDFTIIVAGQEISAHKCILAALCEYFRAAFRFGCSSEAEVFTAERSNSLDLTHLGCQREVVENVVRSFYTNEINLAPSSVQDLLLLADYLMYPELKNCVEAYMLQTLDHHTAVMYFQLVKHYGLNATHLEARVGCLLQAHFHDYFINQAEAVSINTDTLQQYVVTGFFKFCSPLQVCKFLLSTLDTILENLVICDGAHSSSLYHDASRINQISSLLIQVFSSFPPCHITQWRKLVLQCIEEWKLKTFADSKSSPNLQQAFEKLKSITECQVSIKFCPPSHNCSVCSQTAASNKMPGENATAPSSSPVQETDSDYSSGSKQASGICLIQPKTTVLVSSSECSQGLDKPNVCSTSLTSTPNVEARQNQEIIVNSPSLEFSTSNILVLLAPSTEMSSQLMATDEGDYRPLVKYPQLQLSIYDIQMKIWRSVGLFDFPVSGAMLDKHAWRIAFLDGCLYMFSLFKELALEFNIFEKRWTTLSCKEPFSAHGEQAPVKSLIPVAVAGKLIVLSMSKNSKANGTYSTQQKFYEMQAERKTFSLMATVDDDDMELPITQWTVSGDMLVTVKASSMMFRQLSRLQYVHCYNASTRELVTHKISCTMESGIKLLVGGRTMYLLDKSGWYRSYNLDLGEWTGLTRYPQYGQIRGVASVMDTADATYPALSRVTCHAGASRWQVNTMLKPPKSHLEELLVGKDGELVTVDHIPPPHQFVTALCAANMDTRKLHTFHQATFQYLDLKDVPVEAKTCPGEENDQWQE